MVLLFIRFLFWNVLVICCAVLLMLIFFYINTARSSHVFQVGCTTGKRMLRPSKTFQGLSNHHIVINSGGFKVGGTKARLKRGPL